MTPGIESVAFASLGPLRAVFPQGRFPNLELHHAHGAMVHPWQPSVVLSLGDLNGTERRLRLLVQVAIIQAAFAANDPAGDANVLPGADVGPHLEHVK